MVKELGKYSLEELMKAVEHKQMEEEAAHQRKLSVARLAVINSVLNYVELLGLLTAEEVEEIDIKDFVEVLKAAEDSVLNKHGLTREVLKTPLVRKTIAVNSLDELLDLMGRF